MSSIETDRGGSLARSHFLLKVKFEWQNRWTVGAEESIVRLPQSTAVEMPASQLLQHSAPPQEGEHNYTRNAPGQLLSPAHTRTPTAPAVVLPLPQPKEVYATISFLLLSH